MKTETKLVKELNSFPLGRAMQVGGYLSFVVALIHAGRVIVESLASGFAERDGILEWVNAGLIGMVHASPYLFLLGGLLAVAKLGQLYDQGIVFAEGNCRLIGRFGDALAWTAAAMLVIRPTVLGWVEASSYGLTFKINEGGVVTLVAALFVSLMGKVMRRASMLEQENRQFI
jgi:hypothetical protein